MVKNSKRVTAPTKGNPAYDSHIRMYNELDALCRDCVIKDSQSCPCKRCKTDCFFYNMKIAQFVLEEYSPKVIKKELPIESIIRGIEAHGYTGELRQTKVVTI